MFVVVIGTENRIVPLLIPMCFMVAANDKIYPIVANNALKDFKKSSASASGILNFLQFKFNIKCYGFIIQ